MKKIYFGALIMLPIIGISWFSAQKIEANIHQSDLIYNKASESFYLQGQNSYTKQSLEEKFLTIKYINNYATIQ